MKYIAILITLFAIGCSTDVNWDPKPVSDIRADSDVWTLCKIEYEGLTSIQKVRHFEQYTKSLSNRILKIKGKVDNIRESFGSYVMHLEYPGFNPYNSLFENKYHTIFVYFNGEEPTRKINKNDFIYVEANFDRCGSTAKYLSVDAIKIRKVE